MADAGIGPAEAGEEMDGVVGGCCAVPGAAGAALHATGRKPREVPGKRATA
jgi:hypothetical protein